MGGWFQSSSKGTDTVDRVMGHRFISRWKETCVPRLLNHNDSYVRLWTEGEPLQQTKEEPTRKITENFEVKGTVHPKWNFSHRFLTFTLCCSNRVYLFIYFTWNATDNMFHNWQATLFYPAEENRNPITEILMIFIKIPLRTTCFFY